MPGRMAMHLIAAVATVFALATPAPAQDSWPTRAVKILTPLAAGGAAEVLGRTVGDEFAANIRQPVVIENRPGAGGTLAANMAARSTPDGYTLFLGSAGALSVTPVLSKNVPYDSVADFTPLTIAVELPICLVVHKSLPVNIVQEFIAYAKANPGKLSFGSSWLGTTHHLAGEYLKTQAGIDMVHIPYRGGNPAMTDLLAGQIPVLFATLSTTLPHLQSGGLKILGMVEATRSRSQPNIPTIGETVPGYAVPSSWLGFLGPAGMPDGLAQRISAAFVKSLQVSVVRKTLEDSGFEIVAGTSAEFAGVLKSSLERYRKIAADARIEAQ